MGVATVVRKALTVASVLALGAAGSLVSSGPAYAGATGTAVIGSFSYDLHGAGVKVPVGCFLTHSIEGSGKRISSELAGVDCFGLAVTFSKFCNWRIDFGYADTENRIYKTSRGVTHTECKGDPLRRAGARTLPHYGKACARFYVNGRLRATQCHFITK
ncbi:hypothetical protein [Streptomyces alanosinicus]|uniref:Uncharacterized protein n=1 Tax=Streptomyces alanosinicus TaxID=68171 RepID=A0A919D5Z5_9ACTN|nr:hypothetical protein [Streptomyces alanosinicus]GHE09855.1 hypothetical protein GCM10010339_63600 [Streptomyces alanosinicus]